MAVDLNYAQIGYTEGLITFLEDPNFPNLSTEGDLAVTGDVAVTGDTALTGTLEVTGASTLTGAVTATAGVQSASVGVTATTDGLTTGLIPSGSRFVTVTTDSADKVVVLPAAVIGNTVEITVPATGAELQTLASSNATINGVDCDGSNEMAMAAGSIYILKCVAANTWIAYGWGSDGAAQATIVPDADA